MSEARETITFDGVEYVRADTVRPKTSSRVLLILDRGWVYGGDLVEDAPEGRVQLANAYNVRSWRGCGMTGVQSMADPDKVTLDKVAGIVDVPASAELFRLPLGASWGL